MNIKYLQIIVLLILVLFSNPIYSDDTTALDPDFQVINDELMKLIHRFNGKISYLVQKKDGTILAKQHLAGPKKTKYNDDSTIHIASGCKWIAMATVMKLIELEQLSFHDTIGDYYNRCEFTDVESEITVLNLMTHTSGYGYFDDWCATTDVSLQDSVLGIAKGGCIEGEFTKASVLKNQPGTTVLYGDIGMQILGGIVEKATKQSFNDLFLKYIAEPLGMKQARFTPCDGEVGISIAIADGLKIRMQDYANFMLMLMNEGKFNGKQVLSAKSVKAMLTDYTYNMIVDPDNVELPPPGGKLSFGLGSWIYENGNIFSSNGVYGFTNYFDVKNEYLAIFYVRSKDEDVEELLQPFQEKIKQIVLKKKL